MTPCLLSWRKDVMCQAAPGDVYIENVGLGITDGEVSPLTGKEGDLRLGRCVLMDPFFQIE